MRPFLLLIPLLPLLGFVFNITVGRRLPPRVAPGETPHGHGRSSPHPLVGIVGAGSVLLSFLVAVRAVLLAHAAGDHAIVERLYTWLPGGLAETALRTAPGSMPFTVEWAYLLDPLSSVMVLFVTFVGFLIHVYSIGYMGQDPGYARFMAYLNLFMFAMLTLVLAANYAVMFVGWEGVGLCSYLLIGFWFDRPSAADAGKKAFIVNRIGDAGFLLGMFLVFVSFGTLDFRTVAAAAAELPVETAWGGALTLIGLLLFVGACGKSAQLPLHVWLPDAMEGPTPVSALIHAATMVTAGVYMVARSGPIYAHAPRAMMTVAVVGALTAFFAATIGLVQNDIKRVLAYSTVSQLGYMFLACGVGAFAAGVFHVFTHAFFKALLFLGAGSVIHALSGEQDLRRMGGLRAKLPWTHRTMLVGCIAIAGIPPLAGFFSKDEILWSAYRVGGYGRTVWAIGIATAALTAFYMFRLYSLAFRGSFRGPEEALYQVHEAPATMRVPLAVLALGSIVVGLFGVPGVLFGSNRIEHFLQPVFEPAERALAAVFPSRAEGGSVELALVVLSVLVAAAGIALARRFYSGFSSVPVRLAESFPVTHRVLVNKYFVDELYEAVFVRGLALGGGFALHANDRFVVDGGDGELRPGLGVNGVAWGVRELLAKASNLWDRYVVDGAVHATGLVLDNASYALRALQNGLVQHYALGMLIGLFLLIAAGRFLLGLY
jgi:NADH-quinone oxidoreductase subunit L